MGAHSRVVVCTAQRPKSPRPSGMSSVSVLRRTLEQSVKLLILAVIDGRTAKPVKPVFVESHFAMLLSQ